MTESTTTRSPGDEASDPGSAGATRAPAQARAPLGGEGVGWAGPTDSARERAERAFSKASQSFAEGRSKPAHWRVAQLEAIERLVTERESELLDAMAQDLGKPRTEAWVTDLAPLVEWASHSRRKVRKWMRPRRTWPGRTNMPGRSWVVAEPRGTVLVISPWNYPVQLALSPMVAAMAAGNTVVLKPSELTPATSSVLARLIPQYLDPEASVVVEGGPETATALLDLPFDHVFFTGSTSVGRVVAAAAAKNLASVTLELGGKSPAVVAADSDLDVAARRIAWGKLVNAGQSCVAPDYVLVERSVAQPFVESVIRSMAQMEGSDPKLTRTRIVNQRHLGRLAELIQSGGGTVVSGGGVDAEERWVSPTVVLDPDPASALMQDEIFGPILPVVRVESMQEAIRFVRERPKPLSLYLFTRSRDVEQSFIDSTSSGSLVVNHVLLQVLVPELPFGGVGDSGMGAYHGQAGFDELSHLKPVLRRTFRPDLSFAYPPLNATKERILRKVL